VRRRALLKAAGAIPFLAWLPWLDETPTGAAPPFRRVRPGEVGWPSTQEWAALRRAVGGRLIAVQSPLAACDAASSTNACDELFDDLGNPYFISESVALTQTLCWPGAWTSEASIYAVAAQDSTDVAAAVTFARDHNLRLVVKGGGHSYLGGSNAPDSLLIWTRAMRSVEMHDSFVPSGGHGKVDPEPAVSVGTGALWMDAYEAVTTNAGRYVQGGGCTTVGVAGLVLGGGFGSFSKGFGTGAANLLEAEIVTADGVVRTANAYNNSDLFWALKGGGGGTYGVATRLTLRTHDLPDYFGEVHTTISAASDAAYLTLVTQLMSFYRTSLFNPHWGEQITFGPGPTISVNMVFQGLDQAEAEATWAPFFDWVAARPVDYTASKPVVGAIPARDYWNAAVLGSVPGTIERDDLPGASPADFYWVSDAGQVGQVLYGYASTWLSNQLLEPAHMPTLCDALVLAAQSWPVTLHCNKGIAGAAPDAVSRTKDTAMNPAVLDAFALVISGANAPPAYPGIAGHEPDLMAAHQEAQRLDIAMAPLVALSAQPASYLSETNYFQSNWQTAFWGQNYGRLKRIKERYDPTGLFYVHHSVGSEAWSSDGFTRIA
jgi:FAD/FMN-containing dehydrogenase